MRRTAPLVVLALIAALLPALFASPSQAQAPGKTKVNGKLSVEPTPPVIGQKVKVGANFSSGTYTVKLYRQDSGSSSWDEVATDVSNESGNAWFHDVQIDGKQKLYARITAGKTGITNTLTVTPTIPVEPHVNPEGELGVQPAAFVEGQPVEVVANFPDGAFDVSLYKKVGGAWTKVGTDTKKRTTGNAYFANFVVKSGEELFALRSDGQSTDVRTFEPTPVSPDLYTENGTIGFTSKVHDGRKGSVVANFPKGSFQIFLYRQDGSAWKSAGNAKSNKNGDATFANIEFDGPQTLFAATSTNLRTPVKELVPAAPNEVSGGPKKLGSRVIYVTTNSGGTPTTKGTDYEAKTVLVENGTASETFDLETIAVRGNSTADKPKKPYKFKFDKKKSPFGMPEDKTWVLLANYLDWSLVRSMIAWDLGAIFDTTPVGITWFPRSQFAELFINGKYMGSYQLTESIKIQDERVDIKPKWGQIIEFDPHWAKDGVPGFKSTHTGLNYAWKDPDEFKFFDEEECAEEEAGPLCVDPEGLTDQKVELMTAKIKKFETVLYGADGTKDWSKIDYGILAAEDDWMTYLDADSAVDYYLAREFTKDNDADFNRSNFFHTNDVRDDSKLVMGPTWDFDRSAGANTKSGTSNPLPTGWWMRGDGSPTHTNNKIHWFTRIAKDPRFLNKLHARWAAVREEMEATFSGAGSTRGPAVSNAVIKLGGGSYATGLQVAANERALWKDHKSRMRPRASSYAGELDWLRTWYKDRFTWMDKELTKPPPPMP